ncbi:MAG TPA: hypothetical protein VG675_19480 [Bryobacteraceae bacterium]|nr:hypothetical protein [Bryobacteraceae bacterium]
MKPPTAIVPPGIEDSLNAVVYAIAEALLEGGCRIRAEHASEYIPGQVFKVAVEAGWIPEPTETCSDAVSLGDFKVSRNFRDEFIRMLDSSMLDVKEIADQNDEEQLAWKEIGDVRAWAEAEGIIPSEDRTRATMPTPKQIIERYIRIARQKGKAFTDAGIVREANKLIRQLDEGDRAPITAVSISRIRNGDNLGDRIRYCIALLFNLEFPCNADDLLWPEAETRKAKTAQHKKLQ